MIVFVFGACGGLAVQYSGVYIMFSTVLLEGGTVSTSRLTGQKICIMCCSLARNLRRGMFSQASRGIVVFYAR